MYKKNIHVIPLSIMIQNRKITLLGHIIRQGKREPNDPMVQVTFQNKNIKPRSPAYRRVGRPRLKWTEETLGDVWNKIRKTPTMGPIDVYNTLNINDKGLRPYHLGMYCNVISRHSRL